ncbi:hypothetical protein [Salipiger aestuarii]|uniref:hypothetical protein n=1 Tax=Salipiger aestuarii TaxID=568098 RepID=UPI001239F6FA|nr:hypothetical protein [Salipiger aestuarii]KAA8610992.1 hypothetical protein AL037_11300 [Salipiger aestuarii]
MSNTIPRPVSCVRLVGAPNVSPAALVRPGLERVPNQLAVGLCLVTGLAFGSDPFSPADGAACRC